MVTIYLQDGSRAEAPEAVRVELVKDQDYPGAGATAMLACLTDAGERVGYFKWEAVAGYTISPARRPSPAVPAASR